MKTKGTSNDLPSTDEHEGNSRPAIITDETHLNDDTTLPNEMVDKIEKVAVENAKDVAFGINLSHASNDKSETTGLTYNSVKDEITHLVRPTGDIGHPAIHC